jgi:two-component system sensor histidine kinase MprB
MSLRLKVVLALVALSTAATVTIGVTSYRTTAGQLRSEVDRSLVATTDAIGDRRGELREGVGPPDEGRPGPSSGGPVPSFRSEGDVAVQVLGAGGRTLSISGLELPVDTLDRQVAAADEPMRRFRDVDVDGEPYRLLTSTDGAGRGAVQTARSLAETDRVLAGLRSDILVAALLVIVVAAVIGWWIARQVTRRLVRLTAAAEQVASTRQLDVDVPVDGADETGRLGAAFGEMLDALARSQADQQRLVQDAGHELRTPLTSLRTNVFMLRRADRLDDEQRGRVLDDLQSESEELSRLVDEVVELATDRHEDEPEQRVELGALIQRVCDRAGQRSGRPIEVHVDGTVVHGRPRALERAVANLVENALKFAPDGPVTVSCVAGRVDVADRGPGIDAADLPHVFDRFYRAADARSRPGSGLGLAIVAEVAERHGGRVEARNRDGGGAVVTISVPPAEALT